MRDGLLKEMIKEFKLSKTGTTGIIEILGIQDLNDVLNLQEQTRNALPAGQKMFVLPQPESYFKDLLEKKNGVLIGIRTNGILVSQMVLMGPLTIDDMISKQKLTRNEIELHHTEPSDTTVIAKSMAVHPDWRGNELSQHMLELALSLPLARSADHAFAQISVDNVRSWELFLQLGFGIVAAALDPTDQKARFIVQKPNLGFALRHMQITSGIDPAADFAAIMRLTQREALIGQLDEGDAFKLAFYADADMAAAWHDAPANIAQ